MSASQTQIDNYITDVRTAVTDFGNKLAIKQKIGNQDIYCDKLKLMMLSCFLDCIYDYFLQYPDDIDPSDDDQQSHDHDADRGHEEEDVCMHDRIHHTL